MEIKNKCKTSRCVSVFGVKLWNGLCFELELCCSISTLKKNLKNHMIEDYNKQNVLHLDVVAIDSYFIF